MRVRQIALLVALLVGSCVTPFTIGASASVPGIPIIYVNYNPDCTFSMSVDGAGPLAATSPPGTILPPGAYQIRVYMPNPSSGYTCSAPPSFSLTGPGVNSVTTFPNESILDDHVLPNLQPSSTYTARDANAPAAMRVFFSTSATGSSSSLLPAKSATTTASGTSTEPDLVGSALPPLRGRLAATVAASGDATLKLGSARVTSLRAGRYSITVADRSRLRDFTLEKAGGRPVALTSRLYVGKKTTSIALTTGMWTFSAGDGSSGHFRVHA
jgi:hypothetical protein